MGSRVSSSLAAGTVHFPGAWDPPLQTGAVWVTESPPSTPTPLQAGLCWADVGLALPPSGVESRHLGAR